MNNSSRLKSAAMSSFTSAIYQIVVIVCGFVTSRLVIQTYGSSWNGVLASITKFLSLFSIVEMGISGSTRVALYKSFAQNDIYKTSAIIKANDNYYKRISLFLVFYVGILALIIPVLVKSNQQPILVALMVVIVGLGSFAENCWGINSKILLMASQSRYVVNIAQSIAMISNAFVLYIIVKHGGSIFVAKGGSSIVFSIVPIALYIITRKMFNLKKDVEPDKSALAGRWDVLANSLSNIINENVDVFFLTFLCASTEVSVYSLYFAVAGGLTKVFNVIINGIEAGFGNMWVKGEMDTLQSNLRQFEYIMYTLASVLFGSMIVLIVPFMSVYMKGITDVNYQRYALGLVLGIAQVLMSVRMPYVLLVQAAGHYKQVKLGAYLEAGINIVLTFVLVLKFGIIGAIIGTIVANGFRTIQYGYYVSKKMLNRSFRVISFRLLWLTIMVTVSVITSTFIINYISINGWVTWVLAAMVTFFVHLLVVLFGSLLFYKNDLIGCRDIFIRLIKR